jgi:hypothetical protein
MRRSYRLLISPHLLKWRVSHAPSHHISQGLPLLVLLVLLWMYDVCS